MMPRAIRFYCVQIIQILLLHNVYPLKNAPDDVGTSANTPGGYDVLFECLAKQTVKDFELICIDDLDDDRKDAAIKYAAELEIPLTIMTRSKPKVYANDGSELGLLLSRGSFITVVQDNVWLPDTFVERTIRFFKEHKRDALLSYPERRVAPPPGRLQYKLMNENKVLSIFDPPVTSCPVAAGWEIQTFNNTMTPDIYGHAGEDRMVRTEWFECAACTASWELYAALNGLDEALDAGDDSQEANVKDRALLLGEAMWRRNEEDFGLGEVWNDLGSVVVLIDHHQFATTDETWTRFEKDTNVYRWRAIKDLIELGDYPVPAPNAFELARARVIRPPAETCRAVLGVGRAADVDGEPGGKGEEGGDVIGRGDVIGPLLDIGTVEVPGLEQPAHVMEQVYAVMAPRFGYKPEVLFVYAMDTVQAEVWQDGLRAALRLLRRHFHVTLMNVGYMSIEGHPEIDYQIKQTFHFFLGWGRFHGVVDFLIRQYNERINPERRAEGKQEVRMGLIVHAAGAEPPDREARRVYEVLVYPTEWQAQAAARGAAAAAAGRPGLNVHHAVGVDSRFFGPAAAAAAAAGGARDRNEWDVVVVAEFTPEARLETLVSMEGRRKAVGRMVDETSQGIAEELRAAGVEVGEMPDAADRAVLYRSSRVVLFPMEVEAGGEAELVEAEACGAATQVAEDNPKLLALRAALREGGGGGAAAWDEHRLAEKLLMAVWSVLSTNKPPPPADGDDDELG